MVMMTRMVLVVVVVVRKRDIGVNGKVGFIESSQIIVFHLRNFLRNSLSLSPATKHSVWL